MQGHKDLGLPPLLSHAFNSRAAGLELVPIQGTGNAGGSLSSDAMAPAMQGNILMHFLACDCAFVQGSCTPCTSQERQTV